MPTVWPSIGYPVALEWVDSKKSPLIWTSRTHRGQCALYWTLPYSGYILILTKSPSAISAKYWIVSSGLLANSVATRSRMYFGTLFRKQNHNEWKKNTTTKLLKFRMINGSHLQCTPASIIKFILIKCILRFIHMNSIKFYITYLHNKIEQLLILLNSSSFTYIVSRHSKTHCMNIGDEFWLR